MVQDNQRPPNIVRDPSPCKGCTERFEKVVVEDG